MRLEWFDVDACQGRMYLPQRETIVFVYISTTVRATGRCVAQGTALRAGIDVTTTTATDNHLRREKQ